MTERCNTCRYYKPDRVMDEDDWAEELGGVCRRLPSFMNLTAIDWCGEYTPCAAKVADPAWEPTYRHWRAVPGRECVVNPQGFCTVCQHPWKQAERRCTDEEIGIVPASD
jgi:hypothetical protein